MEKDRLGPLSSLIGTISFIVFGIIGYMNLRSPWDLTNIIFGIVIGLLFGFISKLFFKLLVLLNPDIKAKHGKGIVSKAVKRSTIFMFPYAILAFMSTYILGWAVAGVFFSAAIMNTGITASLEVGKLKDKFAIKNTIATSLVAALIAYIWLFSANYLKNLPDLIESLIRIVLSMMGVNK